TSRIKRPDKGKKVLFFVAISAASPRPVPVECPEGQSSVTYTPVYLRPLIKMAIPTPVESAIRPRAIFHVPRPLTPVCHRSHNLPRPYLKFPFPRDNLPPISGANRPLRLEHGTHVV